VKTSNESGKYLTVFWKPGGPRSVVL